MAAVILTDYYRRLHYPRSDDSRHVGSSLSSDGLG